MIAFEELGQVEETRQKPASETRAFLLVTDDRSLPRPSEQEGDM